jgi:hypothetical protein
MEARFRKATLRSLPGMKVAFLNPTPSVDMRNRGT